MKVPGHTGSHAPRVRPSSKLVVLVGDKPGWPPELESFLALEGYSTDRCAELEGTLPLLGSAPIQALLVLPRPWGASELLFLRQIRQASPRTAIVVVTTTPTHPDLKRAFESGATAFLSWPASGEALRQAVDSGGVSAPATAHRGGAASGETAWRHDTHVTVQNRLPPKHPQRVALEAAIRDALAGLAGSWDVLLEKPGGLSLVISVVAPDGATWTMNCSNPARDPESIAGIVRSACSRRRRLEPVGELGDHPQDEEEQPGTGKRA